MVRVGLLNISAQPFGGKLTFFGNVLNLLLVGAVAKILSTKLSGTILLLINRKPNRWQFSLPAVWLWGGGTIRLLLILSIFWGRGNSDLNWNYFYENRLSSKFYFYIMRCNNQSFLKKKIHKCPLK